MSEHLIIMLFLALIIFIILFGVFSFHSVDNLGDALDTSSYKKGYYCKAIGFFIYSIITGYVSCLIINLLNEFV